MAAHAPPDPRIMSFVERYVTTLDDFECLLLLIQTPERWWDAESIAGDRGFNSAAGGGVHTRTTRCQAKDCPPPVTGIIDAPQPSV